MFEFFTVVDENHDDPTIYPTLSVPSAELPFEWEPADGAPLAAFTTKKMAVSQYTGNGWTQTRSFSDLSFTVVITNARVVVYCEKFVKGGGWRGFGLGGLAFAAVANVVSHARAAARRKGKLLVAQVRFPWLVQLGAPADKRGRRRTLRLVVDAGAGTEHRLIALDIGMTERTDPARHAEFVAQLAGGLPAAGQPHWDRSVWVQVGAIGSVVVPVVQAPPARPELEPAAQSSTCSACGNQLAPRAPACGRCGSPRDAAPPPGAEAPAAASPPVAEPANAPDGQDLFGATTNRAEVLLVALSFLAVAVNPLSQRVTG